MLNVLALLDKPEAAFSLCAPGDARMRWTRLCDKILSGGVALAHAVAP